jgi:preprotein translocase subunit YajC
LGQLIILAAMFALLWVLLIRPQRQRQQKQQSLLSSIEPGDEVLTVGGLYGIVQEIDEDDDLIVEIAEGISVRIARRAVGGVVKPEDEDEETADGSADEDVVDAEIDEIDEEAVAADEDSVSDGGAEAAGGSDPR